MVVVHSNTTKTGNPRAMDGWSGAWEMTVRRMNHPDTVLKQAETKKQRQGGAQPSLYFRGLLSTGCFSQEGNYHSLELRSVLMSSPYSPKRIRSTYFLR